ncbi:hypothetical protein [Acinetobacter shaoyimingii]|uniref:Uncharacterized protein n=1 Tax=Acinetobacter shaoyimingii TaxID=2715164 RepID=A0A6G8RVT0_9GAMM|nr:hypothetical protein [Acinetobacter shaoyimingii]QIO06052.1 hypothetical protein G8E00_08850 [Acinetobacter shaoyimingii]
MLKKILFIIFLLYSTTGLASTNNNQDDLAQIFSNDVLKLDFPDGLTLQSMAIIADKKGYLIYFDDNIDTQQSIPQVNTKISSLALFKQYIEKFNLKYKIHKDGFIHIYTKENYIPEVPYSYGSMFLVSDEKYGCYTKVHDIMDLYNMNLYDQSPSDKSLKKFALDTILINAVFKNKRINFMCMTQGDSTEFLHLNINGFDFMQIVELFYQLKYEFQTTKGHDSMK